MKTFAEFVKLEEANSFALPFKTPKKLDVHKDFGLKKPPKPKKQLKPGSKGKKMMKPKVKVKSLFPTPKRIPSLPKLAIDAAGGVLKRVFS